MTLSSNIPISQIFSFTRILTLEREARFLDLFTRERRRDLGPKLFLLSLKSSYIFKRIHFVIQAKLAARRQRRQQEAKRKGQEEAAQRILEEQSQLATNSKVTTAEHIVIPNVVAGQSPEEMVSFFVEWNCICSIFVSEHRKLKAL